MTNPTGPTAVQTPPAGIPVVQPAPTWLTADAAAERASRHVTTIRLAAVTDQLHGHQPLRNGRPVRGGKWTFHVAAVDAWLRGQDVRSQAIACGCVTVAARRGRAAS